MKLGFEHPLLGKAAPAFDLTFADVKGQLDHVRWSPNEANQPLALVFFPLAFTEVCMAELCMLRDSMKEFEELNTTIFGISVDSPFTLQRFTQRENFNFTLLSDFNRKASTDYGVIHESIHGFEKISKRALFLIDASGTVIFTSVCEDPIDLPDIETAKLMLALQ
jgi:peroxiredoxin